VILSAGTFESPRILMLSDIGDKDELNQLGIESKIDLPGVGKNLQDRPMHQLTFKAKQPLRDIFNNLGGTIIYWKSKEAATKSDLMLIPIEVPVQTPKIQSTHPIPENSFGIFVGLVSVRSKGYLKMKTSRHDGPLLIQPNMLTDPEDLEALTSGLELCMNLVDQPVFTAQIEKWVAPLAHLERAGITEYLKNACMSYFHPVRTCAMGNGSNAVVDNKLKVHGIQGLRIADASVMPKIPTANTNAPTLMIGEFMAEVLLGKR